MQATHLSNLILGDIATYLKVTPEELGSNWVAFADAVAGMVASPFQGKHSQEELGKLVVAAVELP